MAEFSGVINCALAIRDVAEVVAAPFKVGKMLVKDLRELFRTDIKEYLGESLVAKLMELSVEDLLESFLIDPDWFGLQYSVLAGLGAAWKGELTAQAEAQAVNMEA